MNLADPVDVLARTIWAEARGEPDPGMQAVACVVLNRAAHARWWGHDVLSVCRAPSQFSCWNADDPNLPKLRAVTATDSQFALALNIAALATTGALADVTNGADSYADLAVARPPWAAGRAPIAVIGRHSFYRLEIPPPVIPRGTE